MAIELVTFQQLKDFMKLEKTAITDYPTLSLIRDDVTFAIEEYLGRTLEKGDYVETIFQGSVPSKMIPLKALPLATVTSVKVTRGDDTEAEDADYYITEYGVCLLEKVTHAKVVVTYNGGLAAVTSALNRAALRQIIYEYNTKENVGARSVSTEGGFVDIPELSLLSEVKRMIESMKHPTRII